MQLMKLYMRYIDGTSHNISEKYYVSRAVSRIYLRQQISSPNERHSRNTKLDN